MSRHANPPVGRPACLRDSTSFACLRATFLPSVTDVPSSIHYFHVRLSFSHTVRACVAAAVFPSLSYVVDLGESNLDEPTSAEKVLPIFFSSGVLLIRWHTWT